MVFFRPMTGYVTSHITTLFEISPQTVRNWSAEFGRYLSTSAAPGRGRNRVFSEDDMRVFSLIAAMKKAGTTSDEIHASLAAGQRGALPAMMPEQVQTLVMSDHAQAIQTLMQRLDTLEAEKLELQTNLQKSREEVIQEHSQKIQLAELLKAAQDEIKQLNREIGKLSRTDD